MSEKVETKNSSSSRKRSRISDEEWDPIKEAKINTRMHVGYGTIFDVASTEARDLYERLNYLKVLLLSEDKEDLEYLQNAKGIMDSKNFDNDDKYEMDGYLAGVWDKSLNDRHHDDELRYNELGSKNRIRFWNEEVNDIIEMFNIFGSVDEAKWLQVKKTIKDGGELKDTIKGWTEVKKTIQVSHGLMVSLGVHLGTKYSRYDGFGLEMPTVPYYYFALLGIYKPEITINMFN